MAKGETSSWVNLDTDALPLIRFMISELERGNGRMRPVTIKALNLAKDIARLQLCPPNVAGERNWAYPHGDAQCLKDRLAQFGLDSNGYLIDAQKWTEELGRMRAEKEEKAITKDEAQLKEGVRNALRKFARPKMQVPSATELLAGARLEREITKTVLSGNALPASSWPKRIAPASDDYVPGMYGTSIPDERSTAEPARPPIDQTKPYWWRHQWKDKRG